MPIPDGVVARTIAVIADYATPPRMVTGHREAYV